MLASMWEIEVLIYLISSLPTISLSSFTVWHHPTIAVVQCLSYWTWMSFSLHSLMSQKSWYWPLWFEIIFKAFLFHFSVDQASCDGGIWVSNNVCILSLTLETHGNCSVLMIVCNLKHGYFHCSSLARTKS